MHTAIWIAFVGTVILLQMPPGPDSMLVMARGIGQGRAVAKLQSLGFEVVSGQDLDLAGMRRTVRQFLDKLDGADMALFFYAGHGLQVNGIATRTVRTVTSPLDKLGLFKPGEISPDG